MKICLPLIFPLAKKSSPHLRIGNWSAAAAVLQPWHFYTWKEYKLKIQTEGKIFLRRLLYCGTNPDFCHEEPKSQNIFQDFFLTLNQLFQIVMLTCHKHTICKSSVLASAKNIKRLIFCEWFSWIANRISYAMSIRYMWKYSN